MAWADQYAVFYRKGTFDFWGNQPCNWVYDIPQGFSCAVGAEPNECSGRYDRFVPVECDEIVLKVAKKIFDCNGDPDCFEGVNWIQDGTNSTCTCKQIDLYFCDSKAKMMKCISHSDDNA